MILILAYGNSLRRDDGAGFVLADRLERLLSRPGIGLVRIDSHQLTPELSLDISKDDVSAVVFIDTRAVAGPSDDLQLRFEKVVPAEISSPSLGHHFDASLLMAYTKHLFKKEPPAWIITVPGVDFDHGEGLSELTRKSLEDAPGTLQKLIELLVPPPSGPFA